MSVKNRFVDFSFTATNGDYVIAVPGLIGRITAINLVETGAVTTNAAVCTFKTARNGTAVASAVAITGGAITLAVSGSAAGRVSRVAIPSRGGQVVVNSYVSVTVSGTPGGSITIRGSLEIDD